MGAKHITLLFVLVAAVVAQESDSSTYILSRAKRSPQYQYSQGVAGYGGARRPYYQSHFAPAAHRPNRLNYQFYGHQAGGFQPGNGYYHYNTGNSFGTPSVVPVGHPEVPGTLMWVPLDTLPFHIHLQQELEFLKLQSAIAHAPIIGEGEEDAVEIPGQFNTRGHRHGWSSTDNGYSHQLPRRRPCLRRHVSHIWTKEGDVILPKIGYEMRSSRNIAITFPSNLYRPPTILREVTHEPTVLHEIRRPASVTLQEVENEVESDGQRGGH
ncbi:hypothetical protein Ocin01_12774 [Orchesella cincta]|uniref:Uncharacterized protein n=1 Tax=Orchesella cincta TaxID=48709 RepID=A0A1D2MLI8_ORCCI|nr:hypothetical protein Ocin01_12774 [Orchesella cincta]